MIVSRYVQSSCATVYYLKSRLRIEARANLGSKRMISRLLLAETSTAAVVFYLTNQEHACPWPSWGMLTEKQEDMSEVQHKQVRFRILTYLKYQGSKTFIYYWLHITSFCPAPNGHSPPPDEKYTTAVSARN